MREAKMELVWWTLAAIAAVVGLVALIVPYRFTSRRYRRLVSKIPGPPGLPLLGNALMAMKATKGGMIKMLTGLQKEYGTLFKIHVLGITHVICTDVDEIEKILSSMSFIAKSADYLMLVPWLGDGLLISSGEKWHLRRKMLTPAFHFRILEDYVPVFTRCSETLVEKLTAFKDAPYVAVNDIMTLCTLDIISETAMGTRIDAQNGGAADYVKAVKRMSELFQMRQLKPWLWRPWQFALSFTGFEQRKVISHLHGFTMKVIKERQAEYRGSRKNGVAAEPRKKRRLLALLDLLLEIAEANPGSLSLEDIREEVDTFMFEGHDTTSAAISWTIFLLALHPEVQKKAFAEQQDVFGGETREPTMADLNAMRYLEQVVKESLRLFPSVPAFSRSLETDVTIKGLTIPEGAFLTVPPYVLHRDPAVFPDPERFDPERFDSDAANGRHPFAYIPFSAGPRSCIGQRFALLEEKAVLSAVVRGFELRPVDRPEDVVPLMELVLRPEKPLRVRFLPRPAH